ncbi:GNAT family N-acetyltransferase [candidate division WOR-3 bacterium]|nr:GNAT family N-acetyltransferase [candidate division WOR-3 bacterium]
MLEIKDLDEETMLDGFCTGPDPKERGGFEKTGANLEVATAERRRFLSDRLAQGKAWGKITYKDGKPAGWIDCFTTNLDSWSVIGCMWVEKSLRNQGIGGALVKALIEDARKRELIGVTVDATVWDHMPKGFFAKCGFVDTNERANISRMILKLEDVEDPQFPPKESFYKPQLVKGKIVIDLIRTGNCPTIYEMHNLVKKAAQRFKDKVVVNEYATNEKEIVERFGKGFEDIYVNGERAFFGYPGEIDKIVEFLQAKVDEIEKG